MRLIILGSGTSTGVPEVGCGCAACISSDPRDKRTRTSALVVTDQGRRILIDCSPDFRAQALRIGLDRVDAILLTHEHYDHIAGLDDLRTIAWQHEIPIYAERRVLDALRVRLHYIFSETPYPGTPRFRLVELPAELNALEVEGVPVQPLRVLHGSLPILGYRIGDLTYITDMKTMDDSLWASLADSSLVVINILRHSKSHPSHQSLVDLLARYGQLSRLPQRTLLTHLSHHAPVDASLNAYLASCAPSVTTAYDGLSVTIPPKKTQMVTSGQAEALDCTEVSSPEAPWVFEDWGAENLVSYAEAWDRQHQLFAQILDHKAKGESTDSYLVFCEHKPVFTLGKHGDQGNVLLGEEYLRTQGYEWFRVERGGDVTYHGPGQITGYPILDLERFRIGLRQYVSLLEECVIDLLALYGLQGELNPKATGVWLEADNPSRSRKICAIGVHSRRYVTMHGFALNVNTDLKPFTLINPCGFKGGRVTSLAEELGCQLDFTVVKHQLSAIMYAKFRNLLNAGSLS